MSLRSNTVSLEPCDVLVQSDGKGIPVIVVSGGPGLSTDYLIEPLLPLGDSCELVFFDQPGCGGSVSMQKPTIDMTVDATLAVIRKFAGTQPYVLVTHSWGALIAARACLTAEVRPLASVLLNPVPLDRAGFDRVNVRLVERVGHETLERINLLSSIGTREAGAELMRMAMPAYCGRNANVPTISLDFDIGTSDAVCKTLGEFSFWRALGAMGLVTLVFGSTDYILSDDYNEHALGATVTHVAGGHFSMLDAKQDVIDVIGRVIGR